MFTMVSASVSGAEGSAEGQQAYLNADERTASGPNGKPSYTIERAAKQLTGFDPVTLEPAPGWGGVAGAPFTVTYAYRSTAPFSMPGDTSGFQRFGALQIAQAEEALAAWADVANIRFARVRGIGIDQDYSNDAAILIGNYSYGEEGAAAFANFPGSTASFSSAGDIWINVTSGTNAVPSPGNYGALVLIHEIGHAIGLAHPGAYNAGDNRRITYAGDAEYFEDSRLYTVMSYFGEQNTGAHYNGHYASAPQLDDVRAAQLEYGPNRTTRTGDTVYGFNATAERAWFSAASSTSVLIFAAWDAGGEDTFDFSGYAQPQTIDLRDGHFSDVGGLLGNVAIASGAEIENAIGGTGPDTATGNALSNRLQGGGGDDSLQGNAGDDRLVGGVGDDMVDGGPGSDIAIFNGASSEFSWLRDTDGTWVVSDLRPLAPLGRDRLNQIETLRFIDRDVVISLELPAPLEAIFVQLLRASGSSPGAVATAAKILTRVEAGASAIEIVPDVIHLAAATTSVATLTYQFFTGRIPSSSGLDFLVSPTGPNPNNLNSAYFQSFNLENRYINFSVNLGKYGEGKDAFTNQYGELSLFEATRQAYVQIFGASPSDTKVHALLDPTIDLGGIVYSRADYFAYYGQDGVEGIGAKAAMVGFLLAEAVKANVGLYARSNEALLTDLADGASLGVDLLAAYGRPEYTFFGG